MDDDRTARGRRRSVIRSRLSLPLTVWVAVGASLFVIAVVGSVWLVLLDGGLSSAETAAIWVGLGVGLLLAAIAAVLATNVTWGLREIHADAVRRLRDPTAHVDDRAGRRDTIRASTELADLVRVLDALQLRARVSDELAEQARRTAEHASAGVYELLAGLVAAEEATRGQLSAELHDTVAQTLIVARTLLADDEADADPARQAAILARVRELVEDAEEQVRAVMARARPAELREGDLASAVGGLRRDFAARYLLTVRLSWPEEPHALPLVAAVTVYRFFQEALLNIVKHADVDEADAILSVAGDQLVAVVRDHGPGFDPAAVSSAGGRQVGLGLLRERARLAGGSLDVASHPGMGTTLTLRLPLGRRAPRILSDSPTAAADTASSKGVGSADGAGSAAGSATVDSPGALRTS
jgi:signal transduction histidine kinase